MADALQVYQLIYPAGNGARTIYTNNINLGASRVVRVLITFPPGCFGQVGAAVKAGGSFAFPSSEGNFVTFDDYTYAIDITGQIDSGQWAMTAYNTDSIDHEIQWVFEYNYLRGVEAQAISQPISL